MQDTDNMVGALKAGQDCLVAVGLLPADDPCAITTIYEQEKVSSFAEERLIIEITYPQ